MPSSALYILAQDHLNRPQGGHHPGAGLILFIVVVALVALMLWVLIRAGGRPR